MTFFSLWWIFLIPSCLWTLLALHEEEMKEQLVRVALCIFLFLPFSVLSLVAGKWNGNRSLADRWKISSYLGIQSLVHSVVKSNFALFCKWRCLENLKLINFMRLRCVSVVFSFPVIVSYSLSQAESAAGGILNFYWTCNVVTELFVFIEP